MAILAALAGLDRTTPPPRVTICGLHLGMTAQQVEESMGEPNFTSTSHGAYIMEYWSDSDRPPLMVWTDSATVYKIEGGIPEVDGQNALQWDNRQVLSALGPPKYGGKGGEANTSGHTFLSYPAHRLLIQREHSQNKFILFRSGRR